MFNPSTEKKPFTWSSPESRCAMPQCLFQLWVSRVLRPSTEGCLLWSYIIVCRNRNAAFSFQPVFPLNLHFSVLHKRKYAWVFCFPKKSYYKTHSYFRQQGKKCLSRATVFLVWSVRWQGSHQKAAIPNKAATLPLIMFNPGKMQPVISHMSHWATKYACPFNREMHSDSCQTSFG